MVKSVDTLVSDINEVLENGVDASSIDPDFWTRLGVSLSDVIRQSLTERAERPGTLRMSGIGKPCNRQTWYSVNTPNDGERLSGPTRLKFLYGHVLEDIVLALVELAGHKVEARQEEVEIEGIKGHWDGIIDGTVIDVKSASSYSFKKFEEHRLAEDDPFGYLDQIESYRKCGEDDERVTDSSRAGFLVVDKTLGHLCLDMYPRSSFPIEQVYKYKKEMVSRDEPPQRGFSPEPDGKSGNMKLPMNCSYCDFKWNCHPELRGFAYSRGPVYLTTVKKLPDVPEFSREG